MHIILYTYNIYYIYIIYLKYTHNLRKETAHNGSTNIQEGLVSIVVPLNKANQKELNVHIDFYELIEIR